MKFQTYLLSCLSFCALSANTIPPMFIEKITQVIPGASTLDIEETEEKTPAEKIQDLVKKIAEIKEELPVENSDIQKEDISVVDPLATTKPTDYRIS